jgi:hypothetical protein
VRYPARHRRTERPAALLIGLVLGATVVACTASRSPGTHDASATTVRPIDDLAYAVTPSGTVTIGGPPRRQPDCRLAQITATATLRRIAAGVAGVVRLHGRSCSLTLAFEAVSLLDSHGHRLPITVDTHAAVGDFDRPDIALAGGAADWGFAWVGSWCGPAATAVRIPLTGRYAGADLDVPLRGPGPPCGGRSHATLALGAAGDLDGQGAATQPAPHTWRHLHEQVLLSRSTDGESISRVDVRLTNTTGQPIVLSPCPSLTEQFEYVHHGRGSASFYGGPPYFCSPVITIAPHASHTFELHGADISEFDNNTPAANHAGGRVIVRITVTGVTPAQASAPIRVASP